MFIQLIIVKHVTDSELNNLLTHLFVDIVHEGWLKMFIILICFISII